MQRHREALNTFEVAVKVLGAKEVPPFPPTMTLLPSAHSDEASERFLSFHMLQGGLNNQLAELAGMVAIANALGRTLVLPTMWSGDFAGNEMVLDMARLLDVPELKANLAG